MNDVEGTPTDANIPPIAADEMNDGEATPTNANIPPIIDDEFDPTTAVIAVGLLVSPISSVPPILSDDEETVPISSDDGKIVQKRKRHRSEVLGEMFTSDPRIKALFKSRTKVQPYASLMDVDKAEVNNFRKILRSSKNV